MYIYIQIHISYFHIFSNIYFGAHHTYESTDNKKGDHWGKKTLHEHSDIPEEAGPIHTLNNNQVILKNHNGVFSNASVPKQIILCLYILMFHAKTFYTLIN